MAEAMSFGLPVITSNVGGGIELTVHDQTGVHFEAGNAASLGAAIERLMHAPELCDTMGMSAAASLNARFGLTHEANEFLTLFRRLIAQRSTH
jgi:glycosyltransferase involved in cell wall biosynthesis